MAEDRFPVLQNEALYFRKGLRTEDRLILTKVRTEYFAAGRGLDNDRLLMAGQGPSIQE